MKFFKTHRYDYVVINFRPKLRNTPVAAKVFAQLKEEGFIKDYVIVPDQAAYEDLQQRNFPGGKMYPDLDEKIFDSIKNCVENFGDCNVST